MFRFFHVIFYFYGYFLIIEKWKLKYLYAFCGPIIEHKKVICICIYTNVLEDSGGKLEFEGEDDNGLGVICKESRLPWT